LPVGEDLEVVRSFADQVEADTALLTEALVNVSDQIDKSERAVPDRGLDILVMAEKCHPKRNLIGEWEGVLGLLAHRDGGRPIAEAGDDFAELLDLGSCSLRLTWLGVRVSVVTQNCRSVITETCRSNGAVAPASFTDR